MSVKIPIEADWPSDTFPYFDEHKYYEPVDAHCYTPEREMAIFVLNIKKYEPLYRALNEKGYNVLTPADTYEWDTLRQAWDDVIAGDGSLVIYNPNPFANGQFSQPDVERLFNPGALPMHYPEDHLWRPHYRGVIEDETDNGDGVIGGPYLVGEIMKKPGLTDLAEIRLNGVNYLYRMFITARRALMCERHTKKGGHGGRPRKTNQPPILETP